MGLKDLYCGLCSGPLTDVRAEWLEFLDAVSPEWPPEESDDWLPIPTLPINEIVTISAEDGAYWEDWVCVSPEWRQDSWVSPACSQDGYCVISYDDDHEDWQDHTKQPYICIHRGCLASLCRRAKVSPQQVWEGLVGPAELQDDWRWHRQKQGLMHRLIYPNMRNRAEQLFNYALPSEEDSSMHDPRTMDDLQWILARPTIFPDVVKLAACTCSTRAHSAAESLVWGVLCIPELLDRILDHLTHISEEDLARDVMAMQSFEEDPPFILQATNTLLSLLLVNKWFLHTLQCQRQGLFLRIVRLYGWMLPASAQDWALWASSNPIDGRLDTSMNWQAFLIGHLRRESPHIKSRLRIFRMITQCVRGSETGEDIWHVGSRGYRPCLKAPDPWHWEMGNGTRSENVTDSDL